MYKKVILNVLDAENRELFRSIITSLVHD